MTLKLFLGRKCWKHCVFLNNIIFHVYLSKRRVYKYSEKLTAKRSKLEAQLADLKDEEAKEVRHGKATLTKQTLTVSFKS